MKKSKLLLILLGLCMVVGPYLFYLDYKIRTKFEARRWNLPSRVYSDAFYLFPGQRISPQRLEAKLKRLSYKRISGAVKGVGEYSRNGSELTLFLHNFAYPAEEFIGFPVRLSFGNESLRSIENLGTDENLKTLRLEPELVASIFDEKMEDRTIISLAEIPEELINAAIAIEDERFYSHHGVDPLAILRAFLTDLLHLKLVQGGSTITQQLVKNYFLTSQKSLNRKINEAFMAVLLEARYSKEEILEAYFNEIYFGQKGPVSVAGVEAASYLYFSKGASQLTLAESALLAGLIRSPGKYSPLINLPQAYDRRNFVLKEMLDQEKITEKEYQSARQEEIHPAPPSKKPLGAPHFVDFLRAQLKETYGDILESEGLKIFTTLDAEAQDEAEKVIQIRLEEYEKSRPPVKKMKEEGRSLEGCLVSVQPQTGYIRAYVGGRDYQTSQFDRVSMAHRQPGSAFKPFIYLTALATKNWNWASLISDRSFTIETPEGPWSPQNYDEEEHGEVSLREALEKSYNIATSRLAMEAGLEEVVTIAKKAGIESPLEPYPSIALGAFEVTPLELVHAYTLFPNNGIRSELIPFLSVVTRDGKVLEKKSFKMNRVVSHDLAYLLNSGMKGVVERGTAASARLLGLRGLAAGKTGTTSDYRDSWFVGYTPELLTLTWVGYDDNSPSGLSGASGGLPVWVDFMRNRPSFARDFLATENVFLLEIDRKTGRRFRPGCTEKFEEVFLLGTEPEEKCR
ncbi:MAG: PBP1A family penicillin-binding protein [Deltaproteobacteria bacterium]|nr:PBP1A family penicillin-binding protein [Deltaproteobacteria bacterium]